ncbi:MAG: NADH-quinone oxidoreductase subunit L [bacterium]
MNGAALTWIVLLPLLGATVLGLLNRRLPRAAAGILASATVGGSFFLAIRAFLELTTQPAGHRILAETAFTWIGFGHLTIDVGFVMDPLSAVMALVVTGVSFLIHIYSIGYMGHDPGYQRFFAYLNLFVFFMLTLVLGENLLMLFVGWEGVGLCSYFLISFWFSEEANAIAGKKAFVVNRVGDFGFLLGILLLGATLLPHLHAGEGVFSFRTLAAHTEVLAPVATALGLLFFFGATGKSAQIPLYVWLPDAMAGPTPVSALIHAATMVTAGVYMIARLNFLYVMSPAAMAVVAAVGGVTALFAATIALTQNDIKKVLAYSTVSQLGYMMLACGVGAFTAGIFHLMTHAFFKALLFLGSGSVIHAMSNEQDMRKMGGLAKKLPITFWTFLAGTFAIAGLFPLAGFFSKDEILWKAFHDGSTWLWAVGAIAAALTAFYMMRLVVLTFAGQNRASEEVRHHIHESPATMTFPLIVLAVLSIVGGWIGWPHFLGGENRFEAWLEPVFHVEAAGHVAAAPGHQLGVEEEPLHAFGYTDVAPTEVMAPTEEPPDAHEDPELAGLEWTMMFLASGIAIFGLLAGWLVYSRGIRVADAGRRFAGGFVHRLLLNKYWVDELYDAVFLKPGYALSRTVLWRWIDRGLIDGLLVNATAGLVRLTGAALRLAQNGMIRSYAYAFGVGVAVFVVYLTLSS